MFKKQKKMTVMDFTGIYENENFYKHKNIEYVSEFWIEKIKQSFILVVFDHHSDMVQPLFDNILSCGSWILNSIENNVYLKKIILISV